MGAWVTCCRNRVQADIQDQYQTLVVSKPAPPQIDDAELFVNSSDSDVPEFAQVPSDNDPIDNSVLPNLHRELIRDS
jgi:hypothetical protein